MVLHFTFSHLAVQLEAICVIYQNVSALFDPITYQVWYHKLDSNRCKYTQNNRRITFHNCNILIKYNLLSFENFNIFKYAYFIYKKVLYGLAPPSMSDILKRRSHSGVRTRASSVDCEVLHRRSACGQNALSVKGRKIWK